MPTFVLGDWSISYNNDLSGNAIITNEGGWTAHMPCELLKGFAEREAIRLRRAMVGYSLEAARADALARELKVALGEVNRLRDKLDRTPIELEDASAKAKTPRTRLEAARAAWNAGERNLAKLLEAAGVDGSEVNHGKKVED